MMPPYGTLQAKGTFAEIDHRPDVGSAQAFDLTTKVLEASVERRVLLRLPDPGWPEPGPSRVDPGDGGIGSLGLADVSLEGMERPTDLAFESDGPEVGNVGVERDARRLAQLTRGFTDRVVAIVGQRHRRPDGRARTHRASTRRTWPMSS